MKRTALTLALTLALAITLSVVPADASQAGKSPVKVFIMAGQSNMEGHGLIEFGGNREADYKRKGLTDEQIATKKQCVLSHCVKDPAKAARFKHTIDAAGNWVVRDDVWVYYKRGRGGLKKGGVTVGYGANDQRIGPEFQFGHVMGEALDNQVLIIKTAWGGKSLALDFRPPSSGKPTFEIKPGRSGAKPKVSKYYHDMLTDVRTALRDLKTHFPDHNGRGYEIAGFVWFQGWNDGCNETYAKEYETNMANLVADVRKDLGVKDLPIVIANSGFGGKGPERDRVANRCRQYLQPAQAAVAKRTPRASCVDTRECYRPKEISAGRGDIEHFYSNAETYFLIGDGIGEAMKKLLAERAKGK